jgi:hypothetical protein
VLTVTAVGDDGLRAVTEHNRAVVLPRAFVAGHRSDGSPNCSHAWSRTVDGIQGGTWPQIHLLGTAALQRFTGYTAQSRGRQATHTWNVTRLPDLDHGGVLADQRTPEREVLDALRRQPDTGFAVHDAPTPMERLLAEQAALRHLLNDRPADRRPAFRQAEFALASAKKNLYWANHRLETAEKRLSELGPLSRLRRHGRNEKTSVLDQIDRFTDDVRKAETTIAGCQRDLDKLRPQVDQREEWDADHGWPDSRLRTVDAELAELGRGGRRIEGTARDSYPMGRKLAREHAWLDRVAEVAAPPHHGPDLGIDLGL